MYFFIKKIKKTSFTNFTFYTICSVFAIVGTVGLVIFLAYVAYVLFKISNIMELEATSEEFGCFYEEFKPEGLSKYSTLPFLMTRFFSVLFLVACNNYAYVQISMYFIFNIATTVWDLILRPQKNNVNFAGAIISDFGTLIGNCIYFRLNNNELSEFELELCGDLVFYCYIGAALINVLIGFGQSIYDFYEFCTKPKENIGQPEKSQIVQDSLQNMNDKSMTIIEDFKKTDNNEDLIKSDIIQETQKPVKIEENKIYEKMEEIKKTDTILPENKEKLEIIEETKKNEIVPLNENLLKSENIAKKNEIVPLNENLLKNENIAKKNEIVPLNENLLKSENIEEVKKSENNTQNTEINQNFLISQNTNKTEPINEKKDSLIVSQKTFILQVNDSKPQIPIKPEEKISEVMVQETKKLIDLKPMKVSK